MYRAVLLILALSLVPPALADYASPRQYYSHWQRHRSGTYQYRNYYYKPSPAYAGYKHHYAVRIPSRPNHLYFYNPYAKKYWGRCELPLDGSPRYSLLAPENQAPDVNSIPESAFPPPGPLPPIPESTDGALLDLPPDDLPSLE